MPHELSKLAFGHRVFTLTVIISQTEIKVINMWLVSLFETKNLENKLHLKQIQQRLY